MKRIVIFTLFFQSLIGSIEKTEETLNSELKSYLEHEFPEYGNGKLAYNIGNTYYQLNAYPYALLWYLRSASLRPTDPKVQHNLTLTREKLNLPAPPKKWSRYFLMSSYLSLPERIQLLFFSILTTFIFCSLYLWFRHLWQLKVSLFFGAIALYFLLNLTYTQFISPIDAVLVRAATLHQDAGYEYAKILDNPLPAGSEVEVMESVKEGTWYQIRTEKDQVGYVTEEAIRFI